MKFGRTEMDVWKELTGLRDQCDLAKKNSDVMFEFLLYMCFTHQELLNVQALLPG